MIISSNKSFTFAYEHRKNVQCVALNAQATLMLSVDVDGRAILVNFIKRNVIHHFNFKNPVHHLKFSPDGHYFAVAAGPHIQVWRTPQNTGDKQFAPFVRHRVYTGHYSEVTSIEWSDDSRFFLAGSKDLTTRIYSLHSEDSSAAGVLGGHKDSIISAFFSQDQETIYSISKDGALFEWKYLSERDFVKEGEETKESEDDSDNEVEDSSLRWRIVSKNFFNQNNAHVSTCAFHPSSNLLVVGFTTGIFTLYELPEFNMIQTLSISQNAIDNVTINKTGEWLAFGSSKLGQLLVWEWQSESYILKQQGHFDSLNSVVYSPDGSKIVTASDDGKIKVWDAYSGFSIVTFTEHTSGVTALEFSKKGNVLFSASLDGSVRAWDLVRYRNFRTFTAPNRVQFSCLAVDPSGEIICAGSLDDFDIHLWSVQNGQLLERLQGHEGPVSGLSFGVEGGLLASTSWDKTVRIWSIFGRSTQVEPWQLQSDVLAVAMRPDSKEVAVATLDGMITFWDVDLGKQVGEVDGKFDISGGRFTTDKFTSEHSKRSKYFTTLCYSADGTTVLAAGNSKHICLYDVRNEVLLKKFVVSKNMALEGTLDMLNSKNMTESGPLDLIDTTGEASDLEDRLDTTLPGASRGDLSARKLRPEIRVADIKFSPTGISFSAASTEGLLVYSQDDTLLFDPLDLDIDVTVKTTIDTLKEEKYLTALIMAFRLNERFLVQRVYESIPVSQIPIIAADFPPVYLDRFFKFLASNIEESPHVEFQLIWIKNLISVHGRLIMDSRHKFASMIRSLGKYTRRINSDINKLSEVNVYTVQYLLGARRRDVPQSITISSTKTTKKADVSMKEVEDADSDKESSDNDDEFKSDDEEGWFGPESKAEMKFTDFPSNDEEMSSDNDE